VGQSIGAVKSALSVHEGDITALAEAARTYREIVGV
jgi:hypothetical protein